MVRKNLNVTPAIDNLNQTMEAEGFPIPDQIQEPEEPMLDIPIRSRKRVLKPSTFTPVQPKYRQLMEAGYKRKADEAKLQEYQEKKMLRSERPRGKPKRYENWGL